MATELLLTTQGGNPQNVSCCFWDYSNGSVRQIYKNGGSVTPKTLEVLSGDYILTAEQIKPLLRIWPINQQEPSKNVRLILPESANALAVCTKNTYLFVGMKSKLYVWELCSGKLLSVQQIHYQPITCIKVVVGYVVITGEDGMLVTYNLVDLVSLHSQQKAQSELGQVEPLYKRMDHSLPITDLHVGKFGFKSRFATVSSDQSLRMYQLIDGQLLLTLIFETPLTSLIVDPQCAYLYVGDNKGTIRRFDLRNPPRTLEHHVVENQTTTFVGHKNKIICLDLNVYCNRLASASEDSNVFIWDLNSRQILRKIELKSVPTNIRFVLTSDAMFMQNYKPKIIINTLERNLETDLSQSTVSVLNSEDVSLRRSLLKRKYAEEKETVQDLQAQVLSLQKLNRELFFKLQELKKTKVC